MNAPGFFDREPRDRRPAVSTTPNSSSPTSHTAPAGLRSTARPAPVIVIADDEPHIRLVVGEKFRSEHFEVFEARDGEEALELVSQHIPDVIVTDLQMPYVNGVELCARLAADPRLAHIPALLLTARGHIVAPEQLNRTVIRRTMAKPFSAKALFETVHELLGEASAGAARSTLPGSKAFSRPLTGEAA